MGQAIEQCTCHPFVARESLRPLSEWKICRHNETGTDPEKGASFGRLKGTNLPVAWLILLSVRTGTVLGAWFVASAE